MDKIYTRGQLFFLITLRLFIGWHFLYEGFVKVLNPGWTSKGYLLSSEGPLSFFFKFLAADWAVTAIDYFMMVALLITGLTLILGYMTRVGAYTGMAILLLFYLAHPPFPGLSSGGSDGNFLFIDRNLIELIALGVIAYFRTSRLVGVDRLTQNKDNHE